MTYEHGHPFSIVTKYDHQAWLWVTSILSLMYSLLILTTRIIVKWGHLCDDDLVLAMAYVLHWAVVVCIDSLLELGQIALPVWFSIPIRMSWYKKAAVLFLFIFRLLYLSSSSYHTLDIVEPLVWQQALTCCAFISATMPVFRGFVTRFTTLDLVRIDHAELLPRIPGSGSNTLVTVHRSNRVLASFPRSEVADRTSWIEARSALTHFDSAEYAREDLPLRVENDPTTNEDSVGSQPDQQKWVATHETFGVSSTGWALS
nr:hypothetical protein CFP56_36482 [Quercus suber]